MVYAVASQVSAEVPFSVAGKASTEVQIEYNGRTSSRVTVAVLAAAPGIFTLTSTGSGQSAILNEDFRVNGPSAPVAPGKAVIIFGTGGGQTTPNGEDAKVATGAANVLAPVTVKIGGIQAEVIYAGAAPGLVTGVLQVNAKIPDGVPAGSAPIVVTVGGVSSQASVTVFVAGK
jgi:uncharacterized protein (TIGR03437 family)